MKPDWDALGEEFENSKKVLIADVDCTLDKNKKLCESQGVTGYPTLKYYLPGEREGIDYTGERDLETMRKFVKTLGPPCTPKSLNRCSAEDKLALEALMTKEVTELSELLETTTTELSSAQQKHEELLKSLQEQYQASTTALEELKSKSEPSIRLVKAALKDKEADAAAAAAGEAPKAEL
jgi:gas vesicle protein